MLHPSQFSVNEAWIAFQLNDAPINAGKDGMFNCVALMDAASCFLLGSELVPSANPEPSPLEARRLLKKGQSHKKQLPRTLFLARESASEAMAREAEKQKIGVVRVPEAELLVFIGEARDGFREHFGFKSQ